MPKFDDYDDAAAFAPLSTTAQQSISNKVATGGFATPVTTSTFNSMNNNSFNSMNNGQASNFANTAVVQVDYAASVKASADAAAITTASGATSSVENTNTDWINKKWRPMMGWSYMATCLFDFIVAPILWSIVQAIAHGKVEMQWQPLTLQGAGLYHVAMGAVLGIAAYGRTKEKLESKTL